MAGELHNRAVRSTPSNSVDDVRARLELASDLSLGGAVREAPTDRSDLLLGQAPILRGVEIKPAGFDGAPSVLRGGYEREVLEPIVAPIEVPVIDGEVVRDGSSAGKPNNAVNETPKASFARREGHAVVGELTGGRDGFELLRSPLRLRVEAPSFDKSGRQIDSKASFVYGVSNIFVPRGSHIRKCITTGGTIHG